MSGRLNLVQNRTGPPTGKVDFLYQAALVLEQRARPKITCRAVGHRWKTIRLDVDAQDAGFATVDGRPLKIGRLNEDIECCERCGFPRWTSILVVGQRISSRGVLDEQAVERIRQRSTAG